MVRHLSLVSAVLCMAGVACSRDATVSRPAAPPAVSRPAAAAPPQGHCLGDAQVSSNVVRAGDIFVIDWAIDVANSCGEPHEIRATYQAWDADNVLVQSDQQDLSIEANARARASGLMRMTADNYARVTRRSGVAQFR